MTMPPIDWSIVRSTRHLRLVLIAGMLVGCGNNPLGLRPVSGTVTVDGKPAKGVQVVLVPVKTDLPDAMKQRPIGTSDANGKFSFTTFVLNDGVPTGDYQVTATWVTPNQGPMVGERSASGGDRLLYRYAIPEKSGITAVIDSSTVELPPIELSIPKRQ
jgi:hypothetical protein